MDIIDLLTVMGAAGGGGEQKARYGLMATLRHLYLKDLFFLIKRKVNPQSMKM